MESTIINCLNWYTDQSTVEQLIGTPKRHTQHAGCLLPSRWQRKGKNKCVMKSLICWGWWIIEPSGGTQWQTGRRGWVCVWVCVQTVSSRVCICGRVSFICVQVSCWLYPNFQIFSIWLLDRKKMCSVLTEKLWSCGAEAGRLNPLLSSSCSYGSWLCTKHLSLSEFSVFATIQWRWMGPWWWHSQLCE